MRSIVVRYTGSTLLRRLLWRTAAFTFVVVVLLAAGQWWLERQLMRADVHRRADHAVALSAPSIEHAVWTFDPASLRLACEGLLREGTIAAVRVDTSEASMRLVLGATEDAAPLRKMWSRELRSPDGREALGRLEIRETYAQVDADALTSAARAMPLEIAKVLAIVLGLTLLIHGLVVARVRDLAHQLRALPPDGTGQRLRDPGRAVRGVDDEIGQLAAALNDFLDQREAARAAALARHRAEASNEAKTQLLSRVGHELRTPLNAILGFGELQLADANHAHDAERARPLGHIVRAARHLARLIDELMDFARFERGEQRLALQPVRVAPLCEDVLALVGQDAAQAGVSLRAHPVAAGLGVLADPSRLEQVLLNLMGNAIKYNRPGGHVELRAEALPDGRVVFRVADDGLGMSQDQLAALYQPFNRLGRERSNQPGHGLGLVITRQLVVLMAGEITVTSHESQGTEFVVTLPAAVVAPAGAAAEAPPAALALALREDVRGRVLVVDDDPVNVEVMRAVFTRRPGVKLEAAGSCDEAWHALSRFAPQLVLLDQRLPDGDGVSWLRRLREVAPSRMPRVLLVSAESEERVRELCEIGGADGWLVKPLDSAALMARVDAMLAEVAARAT